jgi:hypothetical protein
MNAPHDFDRRLTEYLHDGPSRAPERTVAGVLDHARAHPRRPDPIAFIRRDPMAQRGFGSGLRVLPLVAALGLLLVAAFAIASVGGLFDRRPSVVPPPVPTASPSAAPSAVPSPTASASAPIPTPVVIRVPLVAFGGRELSTIEVVDQSGTLVAARTGQPGDGGSVATPDKADVANDPADPTTIILTWTGLADDNDRKLTIAPDGRTMTIEVVPGVGDLLPVDRAIILTFSGPVPAAEVTARIVKVTP